jgi:YD repeat-containing protein
MYIGDSIVKVTDQASRVTTYKFHAYDLAYNEFDVVTPPYNPNEQFSPRLKEITPPGSSALKITYDYNNLFAGYLFGLDRRLQTAGVVKSATRLGASNGYTINQQYIGTDTQNSSGAQGGIPLVHQQKYYGNPSATYYVDTLDGRVWFDENGRNFPKRFDRTASPIERYYYETRSNLTKVTYNDPAGTGYQILAEYPATCSNRKTCNQATRISDAKGNWTDYSYHAASGQVEKITYPANKENKQAETRFTYTLLYATYFNSAGVKVQSSNGIWMKTAEEYCIDSSASGGNCTGDDEVVTTYEYNHPNLLLTGMLVTSPDGGRRTCYRYDDFGNQIGVTTPNANLSSCPGVTP